MAYLVSEANLERQKLLAKVLNPATDRLLSVLQLPSETNCLDLGCGIGETTRYLAERINDSGEITGIELNPDLVNAAREMSSGQRNKISFRQGDVTRLEFADNSFDFVHARFLLMHLPEPEAVLKEMLRVSKPGGVVAVTEPDFSFQRCYPDTWAFERIADLFGKLFPDPFIGRKLWSLFQNLDYGSAGVLVYALVETNENDLRRIYRMTIEAMEQGLIEKGIISEQEFEGVCEEMKRVEQEKNTLCIGCNVFTAWAVKS